MGVDWKALLVLVFLVLFVRAQVSQEAAGNTASSLIPSGSNEVYVVQPLPFAYNSNTYWLVGLYSAGSNSTPNVLVAVNFATGAIETDNSTLQDLFTLFFEQNSINNFNSNPAYSQFSSSNLNSLSNSLLNNVSASQQALQQLAGFNPQISFFYPIKYLGYVYNNVSILQSQSINFLQSQSLVNQSQYASDATVNLTYSSYGALLNDFYNVVLSVNSFDNSLTPIANNLSSSNYSSLMSTAYYVYPAAPNAQSFNLILNYYNSIPDLSSGSASQAVLNFQSRALEIKALNEFQNVKSQVAALSSSSIISTLQSKGFNFTKLASDYNTLVALMNSKSSYSQSLTLMSQISVEVQQAQSVLSTPPTTSTQTQTQPVLSSSALDEFIAIVVVLIIGYYAYLRYKKAKSAEQTEEG